MQHETLYDSTEIDPKSSKTVRVRIFFEFDSWKIYELVEVSTFPKNGKYGTVKVEGGLAERGIAGLLQLFRDFPENRTEKGHRFHDSLVNDKVFRQKLGLEAPFS